MARTGERDRFRRAPRKVRLVFSSQMVNDTGTLLRSGSEGQNLANNKVDARHGNSVAAISPAFFRSLRRLRGLFTRILTGSQRKYRYSRTIRPIV